MPALREDFEAAARAEGVPSALAAARDGIDALLRDRGLRRVTPDLVAESLLLGSAASARIEGSGTGLDELSSGRGDVVAQAAARLNAGLLTLVPVVARSPIQALARMHTLAAVDLVPADQLGRPRSAQGVAERLQAMSRWLVVASDLPAIAVAAVAHAEVATLEVFGTCNGLVARALERLLLVARGVDPTSMLVPEGGHLALGAAYQESLRAYATGGPAGRRAWLLHCATALGHAVELSPLR